MARVVHTPRMLSGYAVSEAGAILHSAAQPTSGWRFCLGRGAEPLQLVADLARVIGG